MQSGTRPKTGGRKAGTPNKPRGPGAAPPPSFPLAGAREGDDVLPPSPASPFPRYRLAKVDSLTPYANNARTHSPEQVSLIAALITEYGFTNPVLVDGKRGVIAGHGRVLAAKKLGMDVVPTIELSHLSAAQRRAYVIADNQSALKAGWDDDLLRLELGELKELGFDLALTGFDGVELDVLFNVGSEGLSDPDDVPEVCVEVVSRLGDVWLLGKHRLMCGDCTKPEDVALALNDAKPHLMVTDPPYGVMLDPSWRDKAGINTMGKAGKGGETYMAGGTTDRDARWDATWAFSPCDVFYVWCAAGPKLIDVHAALTEAGFEVRQFLVWDKGVLTRTRNQYWYTHENCLYGVRKGKTASWCGEAGQSSVWKIPSPKHIMSGSKEENQPHPAQKPVECMRRPIENNSKPGDAVYEPFSGSGTTIIAAEMTGRACHAIEIEPRYIDVAVRRWQSFTGQSATLVSTGATFAATEAERLPAGKRAAA